MHSKATRPFPLRCCAIEERVWLRETTLWAEENRTVSLHTLIMLGVPCASVVLWLLVLLVPPVLSQTTGSGCHTEEHKDGSRQRIVYGLFAQQSNSIKEKCDETVCHAGLSTSANWTFSGFGLTFNQEQTAVRVESCHVHCLQRVSAPCGRGCACN